jgi:hypothetical protein
LSGDDGAHLGPDLRPRSGEVELSVARQPADEESVRAGARELFLVHQWSKAKRLDRRLVERADPTHDCARACDARAEEQPTLFVRRQHVAQP